MCNSMLNEHTEQSGVHHPNSRPSEQLSQFCTYPKRPPRSPPDDEAEPDPELDADDPPLLPSPPLPLPPDPYEEEPLPELVLWLVPLDSYDEGSLPG